MTRLTKEKRDHLILTVLVTLMVIAGLYFGLIRTQRARVAALVARKEAAENTINEIADTIKNSQKIESDLETIGATLRTKEEDMATGDLYLWIVETVRAFNKSSYDVTIKQITQPKEATDMNLLPKFPYKQITVTVIGSAHYHDLGRFIADYENRFPSSRVMNLHLSPDAAQAGEKLFFRMDIASLVRPSTSR